MGQRDLEQMQPLVMALFSFFLHRFYRICYNQQVSTWDRVGIGRQGEQGVEFTETPHECCVVFGNRSFKKINQVIVFVSQPVWEKTVEVVQSDHLMLRKEHFNSFLLLTENTLYKHLQECIVYAFNRRISVCLYVFLYKNVKYIMFCDATTLQQFCFSALCFNDSQEFLEGNFIPEGTKIKFY